MLDTFLVTFIHVIFTIFFVIACMFHTCYICNILMRYMMIFPFYRMQKLRSNYLKYFSQLIKGMCTQDKSQIFGNQCISTELLDVYHSRTDFNMRHKRPFCKYYKLFFFFLNMDATSANTTVPQNMRKASCWFSLKWQLWLPLPFDSCQK